MALQYINLLIIIKNVCWLRGSSPGAKLADVLSRWQKHEQLVPGIPR